MLNTMTNPKINSMDNNYSSYYNEKSLFAKIKKFSISAGQQVIYVVLLLYYLMKSPHVDVKTKLTIAAALGYFILPTDAIPDLAPLIGFTDDLGVLIFVLLQISKSITPEIRLQARQKLAEWFSQVDEKQILAIEGKINGNFTKNSPENK
jgi:uncharacterized membrane protein YkvA (DUF1232 family)